MVRNLKSHWPRLLIGLGSGGLTGAVLVLAKFGMSSFLTGFFLALLYLILFPPGEGTWLDHGMQGAVTGLFAWSIAYTTLIPLLLTGRPRWSGEHLVQRIDELSLWLLAGTVAGATVPLFRRTLKNVGETESEELLGIRDREPDRVLLIGGGFVGLTAARRLENSSVRIRPST